MQNFCLEMSLVKCKCPLGGGKAFQLCLEGAGMAFSLQGLCVALPLSKGCFSKLQVVKRVCKYSPYAPGKGDSSPVAMSLPPWSATVRIKQENFGANKERDCGNQEHNPLLLGRKCHLDPL